MLTNRDVRETSQGTNSICIEPHLEKISALGETGRKNRCVTEEAVQSLEDAGIFRAMVPKQYGGLEATPAEFLQAQIAIAEADMSTGWITGVLGVHPYQISLMGEEAVKEVYGENVNTRVSSSYNPVGAKAERTDGGIMLSGRWGWSSGSPHCDWVLLGAIVDKQPFIHTLLVPRSDYVIEDTWHVLGLEGTASNDIVIEKPVFVPDHRTHSAMDGFNCVNPQESRLYDIPWAQFFSSCVASPAIGAAKKALKLFVDKAASSSTDPTKLGTDPDILRRIGEAADAIASSETLLIRNHETMYDLVMRGEEIPLIDRAKYRYQTGLILTNMLRVVDQLFDVAGGRSVFLGAEIQNVWQDMHTARAHVANNPVPLLRNWGRMILGAETQDTFI